MPATFCGPCGYFGIRTTSPPPGDSSFGIALLHDALGEREAAAARIVQAADERAIEFSQPRQYPPFSTLRGDPRYESIVRQIDHP